MQTLLTIAAREFKALFVSPLAWSILGIVQLILAYLYLTQVDTFLAIQSQLANIDHAPGISDLIVTPLYSSAGIILLIITPLLTMRLICEERRNKTLALLISSPVSNTEIILGKYLGVLGFLLIMVAMVSLMPLFLKLGGDLDMGNLFANIVAISLLIASYVAIGLYMSTLASHPTVAAVCTFGILLLLWILNWTTADNQQSNEILQYFSVLSHFQSLQTGLIDSKDISYFVLFTATFLILSIRHLDNDRLQK